MEQETSYMTAAIVGATKHRSTHSFHTFISPQKTSWQHMMGPVNFGTSTYITMNWWIDGSENLRKRLLDMLGLTSKWIVFTSKKVLRYAVPKCKGLFSIEISSNRADSR